MTSPGQGATGVVTRTRERLRVLRAPERRSSRLGLLALLLVLTVVAEIINLTVGPVAVPGLAVAVPVVLGGLLLPPRLLWVVLVAAFVAMATEDVGIGDEAFHPGGFVILAILAIIALELSRDRERLGLSAGRGEQMLFELRDRLRRQGELPELGGGWCSEMLLASAGGGSFGGDFVVSSRRGDLLEVALVDVSGKGVDAGTRALMLSGALGGLLGAMPAERFLPAANDYLLRLGWDEGFATAVHLALDLRTGGYRIGNAGHLPVVHHHGGSGRWALVEPPGTVLGIVEDAEFGACTGTLRSKDALVFYTDGLVEVPGRDLSVGIDRLLGAAERRIPLGGFAGGAGRLMAEVAPAANDDRALLLLWRE